MESDGVDISQLYFKGVYKLSGTFDLSGYKHWTPVAPLKNKKDPDPDAAPLYEYMPLDPTRTSVTGRPNTLTP